MATYAGRPVFPTFFVDTAGNPQEGISVTVYNRGTTVKPTLYTDRTKATTTANPFTTDAYGNAFPYLDPGDYDASVSGVTLQFSVLPDKDEPVSQSQITGLADDLAARATLGADAKVPASQLADERTFNVGEYPYNTDSSHSVRLQAAIDAASAAGGGTVLVPRTLQLTAEVLMRSNVKLKCAPGAWLEQTATMWNVLSAAGTVAATTATLSANAAKGALTITVDSTAGLVANDLFILGDSAQPDASNPTRLNGEMLRVKTVDSATQLTVWGMVRDDYTTAAGAKLQKVTPLVNVELEDVRIRNTVPGTSQAHLVKFYACRNVTVTGGHFEGGDNPAIHIEHCMNAFVLNATVQDLADALPTRAGYGVSVCGASDTVTIANSHFIRMRHAVTTNGSDNGYGQPRNVMVSDCTATECTSAAFDTHAHGRQVTFQNCTVIGSASNAFQIRSADTRVIGCHAENVVGSGVYLAGSAHGALVKGNTIKHVQNHAISIVAVLDAAVITENSIDGAKFNGINISVNATRLTIVRNRIFNVGVPTAQGQGVQFASGVTSTGHIIAHNIGGNFSTGSETGLTPGKMRSLVWVPATVTGSFIAHNVAVGLLTALIVDDAGSNTKVGNIRLDATTLAAYTQTYATASRTHANPTATSVATTAATNTTPFGYTTQAQADALVSTVNALIVDLANVKQVLNAVIDDGQALNTLG